MKIHRQRFSIVLVMLLVIGTLQNLIVPMKPVQAGGANPFIGEIRLYPYGAAPRGWVRSEGQVLPVQQNTALFSLIGVRYGGNGTSYFMLPDLSGKEPIAGTAYYISLQGSYPSRDTFNASAMLGEVQIFPYAFAPAGYLSLETEQTLKYADNPILYELFDSSGNQADIILPAVSPILGQDVKFNLATEGVAPSPAGTSEHYLGEIGQFLFDPAKHLLTPTDGSERLITNAQALFSLLGNTFGGNVQTNFHLPNIPNRGALQHYIMEQGIFPQLSDPVGSSDYYSTDINTLLNISAANGVLANDTNAQAAHLITGPQHGTLVLNSNGSFSYIPVVDYAGTDSFVYRPMRGIQSGNDTTVTITIRDSNPVGVSDRYSATLNTPLHVTAANGVLLNDRHANAATLDTPPSNGSLAFNPDGSFIYTPAANFFGNDSFLYRPVRGIVEGNVTIVIIEVTDPEPQVDGVTDGGVYNQDVTVNFSNGTAVLNGSLITTGESVSAEGHYTLVVTSISGKTKTIQFTIDKTAPIVTGVTYGSTYLPNIQISFNEGTATLNGYPFTSGSTVSAEGLYTLIVTDSAGNTTTVEFTIRLPIVSYDSNGGTAVPPENVAYNGAATPPSDPTRTGHTFEGWYEDSRLTTVYDFTTPVTADISLYAKWIVNSTGTPTNPDNGGGSPGVNENNGGSPPVKEKESEEENTAEAEEHNESSEPAPDPSISVTDIAGHWAKAAIIKAIELGVVTGYADGTFQPDKRINRAEFMTMLGRALKLPDSQDRLSFSDTNEIPAYARPYISQGVKLGIISGYADGSFAARKELSRSEMTAMIVRAGGIEVMPDAKLSFADAEDIPSWAVPYIAAAVDKGLVEGVGRHRFAPQQTATRAEAVTLVLALLEDR